MNDEKNIIDLVLKIRERTPMYIGGRSIFQLKAFIDGWLYAKGTETKGIETWSQFTDWIPERFKIQSSQSWSQIILFHSVDDIDALDNFFQLFEEFLNHKYQAL